MKAEGPVLVATALDDTSDHAIAQADAIARSTDSALHVCHVLPERHGYEPLFPHLHELERDHFDQMRQEVGKAIGDQLRRVLKDHRAVEVHIESGSPHAGILIVAEQIRPRLIVMGAVPGQVGGVAERVVRYAPCTVLLADRHRGKIVLVATDFSDPARPAVRAGVEEARRRRLPCHVLHSVEFTTVPALWAREGAVAITPEMLDAMRAEAGEKLAQMGSQFSPTVQTVLTDGRAAEAILSKVAELEAELVVIGTRGRSGLQRLAFGSVAESVVRRSRCSVLVVRLTA